jgi:hypothetical protein
MAAFGQTFTHFLQPLHASAWSTRTCWWKNTLTFPSTWFGQISTHFQQAWHWWVSIKMNFVFVCPWNEV